MNKVVVKINGSEYTMVGDNSESYMIKVADFVDQEMGKIVEHNPRLSLSQAGILTALNIANLLFECSSENDNLVKENEELSKNTNSADEDLKKQIAELEEKLKAKSEECGNKDSEIRELNESIISIKENKGNNASNDEFKNKYEVLEKEVAEAKERAKISDKLASEFQNKAYELQLKFTELENSMNK
ncbi:cell division protein ZapA [Metaclostridioides mangenotii]|jgi:cell division protein ZapA|uniref:cell division protein ZapA n=1 Tax=Metaclostridioides mangenotii TaxID=1540 RepID=UPI00047F0AE5|nr:cell division protein ZapA [Clostridioides mangenotii]